MNGNRPVNPKFTQSFHPAADVRPMLEKWLRENPDMIKSRMINDALRRHLKLLARRAAQKVGSA